MFNFNAHLGFQFTEVPFLQRFAAASRVGFKTVEFPSPYAYDASVLADLLQEHQLTLVQFAAPAGETKGLAAVPGKEEEFRHGLKVAVQYAKALGCANVHLMSGVSVADQASSVFQANLDCGVKHLRDHGLVPLVEVICTEAAASEPLLQFESDFLVAGA